MQSEITPALHQDHDDRHEDDSTTAATDCNAEYGAERHTPPSRFLYKDVWYESVEDLVGAMEDSLRFASPRDLTEESLKHSARQLYNQYLKGTGKGLQIHEFKGLAASLAADLGMDPRRFGSFSNIFHRFDVNADGRVDEEECVMLAASMLRHFRHSSHARTPGGPKLLHLEFKKLEAQYSLSEQVGRGGQGTVFIAFERATKHERVVKIYDKKNTNAPLDEIKAEFMLLKSLDHPKIQRLYDIFEDSDNVYIVAEPYRGGDLRDLLDKGMDAGINVTTKWIAKVMIQVMQGVAYLHSKYVIHCDLKESNAMIVDSDEWREPSAVVIDFGMARNFAVQGDSGGTAGYMPPEVWKYRLWTPMGDVFALGVVMFQIFANGEKCFKGSNKKELMQATCEVTPDLQPIKSFWRRNCLDLLPLIEAMLQKDFRMRPTVKKCMESDFFMKRLARDNDEEEEGLSESFVSALSDLSNQDLSDVRRALSSDIAARLNLVQLRELNAAFGTLDTDHDGVISDAELRKALAKHMEADDVEKIVRNMVGVNGQVPYTTFMGWLIASEVANCTDVLWHEFKQLDTSNSGVLSRSDVAKLLEKPALSQVVGHQGASQIMALLDLNGDDRVSFEEFRRALGSSGEDKSFFKFEDFADQENLQLDVKLECASSHSNDSGRANPLSLRSASSDNTNIDARLNLKEEAPESSASKESIPCLTIPLGSTLECLSGDEKLKAAFKAIDLNGDSKLSFEELFNLLQKGNQTFAEDEAWKLFKAIDRNSNGEIDFNEFVDYIFDDKDFGERVEAERVDVEEEQDAKAIVLAKSVQMRADASRAVLWSGGDWRKLTWKERLKVVSDMEKANQTQEKECWT